MKPLPHDVDCVMYSEIECEIQNRAPNKDQTLILTGLWKNYLRTQDLFHIYLVDGEWVRTNLSVIFGHGGHGYVHEFIPHAEIWIDTHHWDGCACLNVPQDKSMSEEYKDSTILHEITEYSQMKMGKTFKQAHEQALEAEHQAGILQDSYMEKR